MGKWSQIGKDSLNDEKGIVGTISNLEQFL